MGVLLYSFLLTTFSLTTSHPLQQSLSKHGLTKNSTQDHTSCNTSGCCPQANGVCCIDMIHCCPEGFICNTKEGKCIDEYFIPQKPIYAVESLLQESEPPLDTVKCPDGVSVCPDKHTCCKLKGHTGLGCCDGSNAVCCEDELHCCPENTVCDETEKNCKKKNTVPLVNFKNPFLHATSKSILCPDGKTVCADQTTCCQLITGTYGCCNTPEAKCCDDKLYCCPHGYTCDPNSDKCSHGDISTPKLKKLPALTNTCPDDSTVCGINDTCCQHLDKSWACCPLKNAVCCSDGYHCCPQNYICDLKGSTCKQSFDVPLINIEDCETKKLPGLNIINNEISNDVARAVFCPGSKYNCKDEQTCCQLSSGDWGCCPSKNAVCCSNKEHCCPEGFKCESDGNCIQDVTIRQNLL